MSPAIALAQWFLWTSFHSHQLPSRQYAALKSHHDTWNIKRPTKESKAMADIGYTLYKPHPWTLTLTQNVTKLSYRLCLTERLFHQLWAWWFIGRFVAFRPKGRRFESRSSRHVGALGKPFTHSSKLRHSIHAMSGVPLSSSGLEEAL